MMCSKALIGGQALDLLATDQQISFETLERIHRGKTGALFVAAATCGALTAGASAEPIASLAAFAKNLGIPRRKVEAMIAHVAHYAGWPVAVGAFRVLDEVWPASSE